MNSEETKSSDINFKLYLGDILTRLMIECDTDDAKLSRETGIPASTISRMRLNPDANPTAATLRPIAKFFGISISQLLGDEPLPIDRLPGTHNPIGFTSSRMPVLVDWNWIIEWLENGGNTVRDKLTNWISTEREVGSRAFALIIPTDSFGIAFRKGSLIIVDPDNQPKDGDLILLKIQEEENILLRQFLKDGNDIYIRSVNPEMKGTKLLTENYKFLGVVIETRFFLQEATKQTSEATAELFFSTKIQEAT
ncbi:MAG TPA: S24 family peptidase [Gammaproteobacteria bacterium]|nr:S24 family peptidase [Gammaproteobacteria bacterium]